VKVVRGCLFVFPLRVCIDKELPRWYVVEHGTLL